jgi:hypothetical protein
MMRTEYDFELPLGYVDESGTMHKRGTMRLATAGDEILPLRDPRCQANPDYLIIILMSRVITRLGALQDGQINPKVIENLFSADMRYLQDLYNRINQVGKAAVKATCPQCEHAFEVELNGEGG